jgi:nitrite reductase/ring-hydroxylating ferredoxin subunit
MVRNLEPWLRLIRDMQTEELGRRALLVSAGCAALGLLGACGSEPAPPAAPATKAPAAPNGALVRTADVPVGGGVVSADGVLVLQLKAGEFTAFDAMCPHQNFRVQPPDSGGTITCMGHMSHFRAADGAALDGPALGLGGLRKIAVKVSGAEVVRA